MMRGWTGWLGLLLTASLVLPAQAALLAPAPSAAASLSPAPSSPVWFEPNLGQAPAGVAFLARGGADDVLVTADGAWMVVRGPWAPPSPIGNPAPEPQAEAPAPEPAHVVRMTFAGSTGATGFVAGPTLPGVTHYLQGALEQGWVHGVPHHTSVVLQQVWPGIDAKFYGTPDGHVEWDFVVAPFADPARIALAFEGQEDLHIGEAGDLQLATPYGAIRVQAPVAFQPGVDRRVEAAYVLAGPAEARVQLGGYDPARALVVDPVWLYGTNFGGSGADAAGGIAVDALGMMYVGGYWGSASLPVALIPGPTTMRATDAFVAVFDPTGSVLLALDIIGGNNFDGISSLQVVSAPLLGLGLVPVVYAVGSTYSTDFPLAGSSAQSANGGAWDVFVAVLEPLSGRLVYTTYLGGPVYDYGTDIAVDLHGNPYIIGLSMFGGGYPTTDGAFERGFYGCIDAFVTKIDVASGALAYSTMLAGNLCDWGWGIAVDKDGRAYATGTTGFLPGFGNGFPLKNPIIGTTNGFYDAFLTVFNPQGTGIEFSTFLGGSGYDRAGDVALDATGNVFVVGDTASSDFFTVNAAQPAFGGGYDGFAAKINAGFGAFGFSTYIGGSSVEQGWSAAVTPTGDLVVKGTGYSSDFPRINPVQPSGSAWVQKLGPDGTRKLSTSVGGYGDFSVYNKGLAVDALGDIYMAGAMYYFAYKNTINAVQCTHGGGITDAFVGKMLDVPVTLPPEVTTAIPGCSVVPV